MKKEKHSFLKLLIIFMVLYIVTFLTIDVAFGQNTSGWEKIQEIEIPEGLEIHSGIDENGIAKYWFQFEDTKVFINAKTHNDYIEGTVTLILTEWKVLKTGKYRYTVRKKEKDTKDSNRLNLNKIFNET